MTEKGEAILNAGTVRGKTLEYKGKWGAFILEVSLKHLTEVPDMFMLSIKSPFFNMVKELVKKDVLDELNKILDFLEYK